MALIVVTQVLPQNSAGLVTPVVLPKEVSLNHLYGYYRKDTTISAVSADAMQWQARFHCSICCHAS